jgi:hypothetical protein
MGSTLPLGQVQNPTQTPAQPKATLPLPEPAPPPPSVEKKVFSWLDRQLGKPAPAAKYQPAPVVVDDFESNPPLRSQDVASTTLKVGYGQVPGSKPFVEGVSFTDPVQGGVGDCHFIASLSAVAMANPKLLERAIEDKGGGRYLVTLYVDTPNGSQPVKIPITDKIPLGALSDEVMHKIAQTTNKPFAPQPMTPLYAAGADPKELWPALFEKAYAKWKGQYEQLDGGFAANSLFALTGVKATELDIDGAHPFDSDALFTQMKSALQAKRPVLGATLSSEVARVAKVLGTPDPLVGKFRDLTAEGLREGHQYTVLEVSGEGAGRRVTLRDPQGRTDYAKDLRPHQEKDGVFTMPYADFLKATAHVALGGAVPSK